MDINELIKGIKAKRRYKKIYRIISKPKRGPINELIIFDDFSKAMEYFKNKK